MPVNLELVVCKPAPILPDRFNRAVVLPYGLTMHHIRKAMEGFADFLGFVNQQLHTKQLPRSNRC